MKKIMKLIYIIPLALAFITNSLALSSINKYIIVPIDLKIGYKKPYTIPSLKVSISHKTIPLMIDTGFGSKHDFVLSNTIAKRLKLIYTGKKECSLSQSGKTCREEVIIPNLKIGGRTFKSLTGLISHGDWGGAQFYKNFRKTSAYENGVVTLEFLKRFNVLFDYKHNAIKLYPINADPPKTVKEWKRISFMLSGGNITTSIKVKQSTIMFVWDTGYLPSQLQPKKLPISKYRDCPIGVYRFFKFKRSIKCFYTKDNKLINHVIPRAVFVVKSLGMPKNIPIAGFVGSNYFYHHKIFMDFKSRTMYVN